MDFVDWEAKPKKVLKTLDFQVWEGPKVLKLYDPGKFRRGHGPPGPPSYPDAEFFIAPELLKSLYFTDRF